MCQTPLKRFGELIFEMKLNYRALHIIIAEIEAASVCRNGNGRDVILSLIHICLRRNELATAVGAFLEATPVYQKAPT